MITSLQYVALGVPDLKPGVDFYETFGLQSVERPDHVAMRCYGREQDQVVLVETGEKRKLHHVSLGTTEDGLCQVEQKLETMRIQRLDPPYANAPHGLWFRDPEGSLINLRAVDSSPYQKDVVVPAVNRPGLISRAGVKGCRPLEAPPRPRRMGHVIIFAKDVLAQTRFYCDVLGFRLSDQIADGYAAFLRASGDSDHHVLAMLKSDAPGFHHASFEMSGIDESEVAAMRVISKGYRHAWGPGRHGVGSNYFHYFRDPWNGLAEYFSDMDYIPGQVPWEPKEWTKKDGMFLWSADGMPPPDFGRNYELD